MPRASTLLLAFCIAGFVFLYAPILSLVIFSFNESKLVTVWGGFSTKWYRALLEDPQILGAAWISLKVAVASATLSVVLGTLADIVVSRNPILATRVEDIMLVMANGVLRVLEPELAGALQPAGGRNFESSGVRRWIDDGPG